MDTLPANLPWLVVAGVGTGILGALLGTGGGVFLIPVLVLGFGVPMHSAVATSIISVIATSSAVASVNVERGTANMRLGMTLEVATALGAITGGLTAAWLPARGLEALFALVLVPTAILMWRRGAAAHRRQPQSAPHAAESGVFRAETTREPDLGRLGARYFDPGLQREVMYRIQRLWAGLTVSFVAGNLSGLLGIGGGVFKVPALHLLCGVPIKAAAATSNFMIGVTATASAFLYFGRGDVRPVLTAVVILGVLAGSALGSWISPLVRGEFVKRLFAVLLLAVALQMLVRVWTA